MEQQPVTRYTTDEERANIIGIDLDPTDVQDLLGRIEMGLVSAAAMHEAAVQENMGLSAHVTVTLSRGGVQNADGGTDEVVGTEEIAGVIKARKTFVDEANKPQFRPVTS